MKTYLKTKSNAVFVRQATFKDDPLDIQKVLRKYSDLTGFCRLAVIEQCIKSGCTAVAVLKEDNSLVGATVGYIRKKDKIVKSHASSILEQYRGLGIWRALKTIQLQYGIIEWKTTQENESNKIFAHHCRLYRVEKGNLRKINVWRLYSFDDPYSYFKIRGEYIFNK